MSEWATLISAFMPMIWPLLLLFVFMRLQRPISTLIESARGRKFTIKVGENELTMEEASEQQRTLLADLQAKVADLENRFAPCGAEKSLIEPSFESRSLYLLWADDRPKNNSFLVANLTDRGHRVDIALSTEDALGKLKRARYDAVISDMSRPEGDKAGIDLTRRAKAMGLTAPIYIYCGEWAARHWRDEALAAGVADITNSSTTLLGHLLENSSAA